MFRPYAKIFLRTPIYSIDDLSVEICDYSNLPESFLEGIYLASKNLYYECIANSNRFDYKLHLTLKKYFTRSCTRSTPFATFAGVSLIDVCNEGTEILLDDQSKHRRETRLDFNLLNNIILAISKLEDVKNKVKFFVNNSLYDLGNSYRYVEYTLGSNSRSYDLVSVIKTGYLSQLLDYAKNGSTINELVSFLINITNVTENEARKYIKELIDSQILNSELEPNITGDDSLKLLISKMKNLGIVHPICSNLENIYELMNSKNSTINRYIKLDEMIKELPLEIKIPKNTLQVDMHSSLIKNKIEFSLVSQLVEQIQELRVFTSKGINPDLNTFIDLYKRKYDDAEMPLAHVIDNDLGVGYGDTSLIMAGGSSKTIDDLAVNYVQDKKDIIKVDSFIFYKYVEYLKGNLKFIEITDKDIERLKGTHHRDILPYSMYVKGSILKRNERFDSDNFIFDLSHIEGPGAVDYMGRFCSSQGEMQDFVKNITGSEKNTLDGIYAEIAHIPDGRAGNVLFRPILRDYEIPYVGQSGTDNSFQIPISDISVKVIANEVILTSKRLKKRIIPRLSSAHNFHYKTLPIYKFLCDLQMQNVNNIKIWDWGNINQLDFYPRVVYKNIILHKAKWTVPYVLIKSIRENKGKGLELIKDYFKLANIYKRVTFKEGDNEMIIDISDDDSLKILLKHINKTDHVQLDEFLFNSNNCIVIDRENRPYSHELIIPIYNDEN